MKRFERDSKLLTNAHLYLSIVTQCFLSAAGQKQTILEVGLLRFCRLCGVVAVLVLAPLVGKVATAQSNSTEFAVGVTATVGPYAEIQCEETLTLPAFAGLAYEQQHDFVTCTMESNTAVNLVLQAAPLTHNGGDSTTTIGTAVMLEGGHLAQPLRLITGYWPDDEGSPLAGHSDYSGWTFGNAATSQNSPAQGENIYSLMVWGKLGEIPEQPAGTYSTDVVLTLSFD